MTEDSPDTTTVEFEPDDMGTGEVQSNGMLYVGREHAGKAFRWLIEEADDGGA